MNEGNKHLSENMCTEFFFFKQKTAYEIRNCDWSSDVCSSVLGRKIAESGRKIAESGREIAESGRKIAESGRKIADRKSVV